MTMGKTLDLARRFIGLPADKRRLFLDGLRAEGIDFSVFPIAAGIDAPDRNTPSYSQRRMWLLWRLDPHSAAYNLPCAVRIEGPLERTALERAFAALIERHETLRCVFQPQADGELRVVPATQDVVVQWCDIAEQDEKRIASEAEQQSLQAFDLTTGPLLRIKVLRVDARRHVLLLTLHHIIADGWSINLLIEEFTRLYESVLCAEPVRLAALPIQHADYALWQRRWLEAGEAERQLEHWRGVLGDEHPVLELPADRPRPAAPSFAGRRFEFEIDADLSARLHALASQCGATPFMLLLAAWQILLHRYSGQNRIRVGVPVANRNREEIENLIGCFVNTQVLQADIDGQSVFSEFLQQVKYAVLAAQAHQELPFEQLVEALQPERSLSHNPLFQVVYNHQPQVTDVETVRTASGLAMTPLVWASRTTPFDLSLDTWVKNGRLLAALTYAVDLFDADTIEQLALHWRNLLQQIVAAPQRRIGDFALLSVPERRRVLSDGVDTNTAVGIAGCIQPLIEAQVERTPDAVALIAGDGFFTYRQLNEYANRLAHRLIELGAGPERLVGIALERGFDLVAGLLAILKTGAAYVPLDPNYPRQRLADMAAQSGLSLLLTRECFREIFNDVAPGIDAGIIAIDTLDLSTCSPRNPDCRANPRNLLCLLYTSGSTGRPKGVAIERGAINAHIQTMQGFYEISAQDCVLHFASINFDWGTEQWLLPLIGGARMVLRADAVPEPAELAGLIERHNITVAYLPTQYARQLAEWSARHDRALPLRCFNVAGEALEKSTFDLIRRAIRPRCIVNGYGPTETIITPFLWRADADTPCDTIYAPVGRPVAGRNAYRWDNDLNLAPLAAHAELVIGGEVLARGYYQRPGLTAERFVPDPFGAAGGRVYRTGDLTRSKADGVIDYIGRIDHQVKVRGFRVEPGEIEMQLLALPGIDAAVVIARPGAAGLQLVAYVASAAGVDTAALKQQLAARLPDYMVPAAIVALPFLPLNPNGKVDRRALPDPDNSLALSDEPPQGELETTLAALWAEILGVERVGRFDNFFELGGHSLLAIQLLERVRQHGFSVEPRALFRHPQLADFAAAIAKGGEVEQHTVPANGIPDDCAAITPGMLTLIELDAAHIRGIEAAVPGGAANIQDIYPLAPLQEGILFHHLLQSEGDAYVTPCLLAFDCRERLEYFVEDLNQVIIRHDILRTAVLWEALPEPVQVVQREARVALEWFDAGADTEVEERLNRHVHHSHFRIDVRRAPLIRAIAAEDPRRQRWLLQLPTHHLVLDHTTLELLVDEIALIRAGRGDALPPPVPFRHFVGQARLGVDRAAQEQFFRHMLGDVTEPTAPFGLLDVRGDGTGTNTRRLALDADFSARIRRQAQRRGCSAAALLHLAWAAVLGAATGRDDVVFGTVLFGRMQGGAQVSRALGLFINTLPVRLRLGERGLEQNLLHTHNLLTDLLQHEHASLALAQRCSALPAGTPLFSSLFNYRHNTQPVSPTGADGWAGVEVLASEEHTNYPFNLSVDDCGEFFELVAKVDNRIDAGRVCDYLHNALTQMVQALEEDRALAMGELNLLARAEQARLRDWGVNSNAASNSQVVHRAFERHARNQPDATALIFDGDSLGYAELNRRANRLAHHLIGRGIKPEHRVGLAVERSFEMVVGLFAILKAGAAYVPLDMDYPAERLRYMIDDSGIALLLTHGAARAQLPPLPDTLPVLDIDALSLADEADSDPGIEVHGEQLAYVIYTSGSTGRPKGAANRHTALASCMAWMQDTYGLTAGDTVLHKAAFGFDVSAWEIFWPLTTGARLVLANPGDHRDPARLIELIRAHRVTVVNFVPSMLQAFLDTDGIERETALRHIICGGEAMPPATQRKTLERLRGAQLQNLYGPTETAIHVTHWTCRDDARSPVPIGRPIAGTRAWVLDGSLNPAPIGVAGELYLGGIALGRGYLHRAALTAERFVPDPFDESGGRLYRTGDLTRWNAEGYIDYLGRIDHQVKVRGFRIELGEIEACLHALPAVRETVVLAQEGAGGKVLVAYILPDETALAGDNPEVLREPIKQALQAALPAYMVPPHLLFLEQWPLTPNGKLDRAALPLPDVSALQSAYVAPINALEQEIAALWADVLKLERVGRFDNFFELGGDSIIALQVVSRARQTGIRFSPRDLFQQQTVQALAAVAQRGGAAAIDQQAVTGELPLLPIHHWFFAEKIPDRDHWNQAVLLKPLEHLDKIRIERALQALIHHHDALRLRFTNESGEWRATFDDAAEEVVLWTTPLETVDDVEKVATEAQRSLSLRRGPLLRAVLMDLPDGRQRLLLVIHHSVVDGVSWRILLEDLHAAYQQAASNAVIALPAKTSAYQRWAQCLHSWADSAALREEQIFWQTQLRDAPCDLPCVYHTGAADITRAHTVYTRLDRDLTRQLLQQAPAAYRTRGNELLLAALARVLCRWSGQHSALIQLEGHGREDLFDGIDLTRTVGWFTSLYPVLLQPADSWSATVKTIKEQLRAVPNQGLGFGVLRYLGDETTRALIEALPQPRITFNYLGQFDAEAGGIGALFERADEGVGEGQNAAAPLGNWLSLNGQVLEGELEFGWTFSRDLFDTALVQHLADEYARELRALIAHCVQADIRGVTPSDFPLAALTQAQLDALPIDSARIEDIYPLAPLQQGMLFHTLLAPDAGDYVNQLRVDVFGLDVERFRAAWQFTLETHAILRTGFVWQGLAQPVQVVLNSAVLPCDVYDWRDHSDLPAALETLALSERERGFDPGAAPLLRLALVRTDSTRFHLIYTNHHILLDGWSNAQLLGEILQRYAGQIPAQTPGRYRDHIAWLQRQDAAAGETFWKNQLRDWLEPTLLLAAPVSAASGRGEQAWTLDTEHTRRLFEAARAHKVTVNTIVQAAWLLLLQRRTGQDTVAFGATVAGRPAELHGIERQIGLFINTLPVIGTPRPELGVADWLQRVQTLNLGLREQEQTPLFDIQRWAGRGGEALFDTLLVFENYPVAEALARGAPEGLRFGPVDIHEQTNYPLTVAIETGATLSARFSYDSRFADETNIAGIAADFERWLCALIDHPQAALGDLPKLHDSEYHRQIVDWNHTRAPYAEACVHRAIEMQAAATPRAIALRAGASQLSYAELNTRANRLAHQLIGRGVCVDMPMAIAAERSIDLVVGQLAILKAGGAYVPLDPTYPRERLRHMLADCGAPWLLTQRELQQTLPVPAEMRVLCFDDVADSGEEHTGNPDVRLSPDNRAYIIYTSGSTGVPKGVAIRHGALRNHMDWMQRTLNLDAGDRVLQKTAISFDASVWEFWLPLMTGAQLVLAPPALNHNWPALWTLLEQQRITTLQLVPSLLRTLLPEVNAGQWTSLRRLLLGGEALDIDLLRQLPRSWDGAVYNLYGPTEVTIDALCQELSAWRDENTSPVPIGRPVANISAFVLGDGLEPAPLGERGELYLGGAGLARGYHGRPALTAERFVPDPFAADGGRLYRTGDLARYRADATLDYAGRADQQVKIRGLRIEPGEIEAVLRRHAAVRSAAVVAIEGPAGQQLAAYVVPAIADAEPGDLCAAWKTHLQASLPDYLVPACWCVLDQLPLTPGGKLDRRALPPPTSDAAREYAPPATELEQRIAAIWRDVLKIERIGRHDHFFELGGHSLLAISAVSRLQLELGIGLTPQVLFQFATLSELAAHLEENIARATPQTLNELSALLDEMEAS